MGGDRVPGGKSSLMYNRDMVERMGSQLESSSNPS